jgi:YesN/AraC family two-component response regulator
MIREYKKSHPDMEYPYELEAVLIDHVRAGDQDAVEDDLQHLLHVFSALEMGDLEGVRTKTLWLFAMILRTSAERDREINSTQDDNLDIINRLSGANDFDELSSVSLSLIRQITGNMISRVYKGTSQLITDALRFIHQNYQEPLSLQAVSGKLHVNSSYFSSLFRQEIGITFTDYLNQLRVGQACHLLTDTDLRIVEVAAAVGYDDQSYFTRVFRKYKGITPGTYRKSRD